MYITGSQFNFEERLHQLPTGLADLDIFKSEATGYAADTGIWHSVNYWNKEFIKKYEQFDSPSGSFFLTTGV